MSTGSLAFIIFSVIIVQVVAFALFVFYRRKRQMQKEGVLDALIQTVEKSKEVPAWSGFKPFTVQRKVFENTSKSVCSFYLMPKEDQPLPSFLPGQFLSLKVQLPSVSASDEMQTVVRCYSLSDRPRKGGYRITVKRALPPENHPEYPPGRCSNYLFDHIQEGDVLEVKAPSGQFYLKTSVRLPIVLIGGGIGITPMLSMLSSLLEQGYTQNIWLFYGVRDSDEQIMKKHLLSLQQRYKNFHLHVCYSQPKRQDVEGVDYHCKGYVDINRLKRVLPIQRYQFYVCGSSAMMESLVPALEAWGVAAEHIHYESFGPSTLRQRNKTKASGSVTEETVVEMDVNFCQTGTTIPWDAYSESLLELAENNGISVESGCRSGSCGSCQTRLVSGEIEYISPPEIEVDAGHCLLCIAKPKSDIVLEA